MNKSAESGTKQFETASADFSAVISTVRRNLTQGESLGGQTECLI